MVEATKEFLKKQEELYLARIKEIRETKDELVIKGTTYFVSADGDDSNDGKSPETPWKTINRVSNSWLLPGDGVLFRRGDLFRGSVTVKTGVSYGAYGTGEKPKFYGWIEDLAAPDLWEIEDKEHNIWKYVKKISDPGTLVFNHGEAHSRKLIPSYVNLQFVCRDDESRVFEMKNEMTKDLDIFWKFDTWLNRSPSHNLTTPIPLMRNDSMGELYVRCDRGNPGEVFDSIEAIARGGAFSTKGYSNVHIDNLCIKYFCFGVTGGYNSLGLHVTNCEIGWIGGNIQGYTGTDPNYPQGTRGSVTRYGNAIEIFGNCEDYLVDNCYVYQSYDAGMSHQVRTSRKMIMKNVRYTNNLIEKCVYGIEYFICQQDGESESCMDGIEMSGNIIRLSGYGWGQQRHNIDTPALIKGWSFTNPAKDFRIFNNVFDRSAYRMLHLVALKEEYCPEVFDNIYIQDIGGKIGQYGANEIAEPENLVFDENAEKKINEVFGDKTAKVYYIK